MNRSPNPNSPEEVRRAIQQSKTASDTHDAEIDALESDVAAIESDVDVVQGDVANLDSRVEVLEESTSVYTSEVDSDVVAGQPLYLKENGHVDLAYANSVSAFRVVGLATTSVDAGQAVDYSVDNKLSMADWTDIIGSASLTPGAVYFLNFRNDPANEPSYDKVGGQGDRTAIITVTTTAAHWGNLSTQVNGLLGEAWYFSSQAASGLYLRYDFGALSRKWITEATWYQDNATTQGTWRWQASNDGVIWTNIGNAFTLGGTAQVQTELSGNTHGYQYYQLLGISGSTSTSPWLQEINFKIADLIGDVEPGKLSATAPETVGYYLVKVGTAISTEIFDIEIDSPILL